MSKTPDDPAGKGAAKAPGVGEPEASDQSLAATKEFIETFFKRGAEFTEELLRENERLRFQNAKLDQERKVMGSEAKPGSSGSTLRELAHRIETLEAERSEMLDRFRGVEAANQDYLSRYHEIERENNNLANLYVASYQLHATLDLREVTQIILEILLNFVGAKTFAVQLVDDERGRMRTLAAEGIERARVPEGPPDAGRVGEVMRSGQPWFDAERITGRSRVDLERPTTVIPLKIRQKVVGVVIIWDFLAQKTDLVDVDYELFNLLAGHAACALQAAKLNGELAGRTPALWAAADLV